MQIDIEKELGNKNPARVAPQVRKLIKVQIQRVRVHILFTLIFITLIVLRIFLEWIPFWLQVISFIALPFCILSLYCDSHLLKHQKKKLKLIEDILNQSAQ